MNKFLVILVIATLLTVEVSASPMACLMKVTRARRSRDKCAAYAAALACFEDLGGLRGPKISSMEAVMEEIRAALADC